MGTEGARLRWFPEAVVVVAPVAAMLRDPSHEEMAVEGNERKARMEAVTEAAKQRGKAKGMGVVVLAMEEELPYMKNGKISLSLP